MLSNLPSDLPARRACARARAHTNCHTLSTLRRRADLTQGESQTRAQGTIRGPPTGRGSPCTTPALPGSMVGGVVYPGVYRVVYTSGVYRVAYTLQGGIHLSAQRPLGLLRGKNTSLRRDLSGSLRKENNLCAEASRAPRKGRVSLRRGLSEAFQAP